MTTEKASKAPPKKRGGRRSTESIINEAVERSTQAAAELIAAALKDRQHVPGGRKIEATPEVRTVSMDEYRSMTDDEKAAYNAAQAKKIEQRQKQAEANRFDMMSLPRGQRAKMLLTPRDPSIIRDMDNIDDEDMIEVICVRKVSLDGLHMTDVGEKIRAPRSAARKLSESGAVKVSI